MSSDSHEIKGNLNINLKQFQKQVNDIFKKIDASAVNTFKNVIFKRAVSKDDIYDMRQGFKNEILKSAKNTNTKSLIQKAFKKTNNTQRNFFNQLLDFHNTNIEFEKEVERLNKELKSSGAWLINRKFTFKNIEKDVPSLFKKINGQTILNLTEKNLDFLINVNEKFEEYVDFLKGRTTSGWPGFRRPWADKHLKDLGSIKTGNGDVPFEKFFIKNIKEFFIEPILEKIFKGIIFENLAHIEKEVVKTIKPIEKEAIKEIEKKAKKSVKKVKAPLKFYHEGFEEEISKPVKKEGLKKIEKFKERLKEIKEISKPVKEIEKKAKKSVKKSYYIDEKVKKIIFNKNLNSIIKENDELTKNALKKEVDKIRKEKVLKPVKGIDFSRIIAKRIDDFSEKIDEIRKEKIEKVLKPVKGIDFSRIIVKRIDDFSEKIDEIRKENFAKNLTPKNFSNKIQEIASNNLELNKVIDQVHKNRLETRKIKADTRNNYKNTGKSYNEFKKLLKIGGRDNNFEKVVSRYKRGRLKDEISYFHMIYIDPISGIQRSIPLKATLDERKKIEKYLKKPTSNFTIKTANKTYENSQKRYGKLIGQIQYFEKINPKLKILERLKQAVKDFDTPNRLNEKSKKQIEKRNKENDKLNKELKHWEEKFRQSLINTANKLEIDPNLFNSKVISAFGKLRQNQTLQANYIKIRDTDKKHINNLINESDVLVAKNKVIELEKDIIKNIKEIEKLTKKTFNDKDYIDLENTKSKLNEVKKTIQDFKEQGGVDTYSKQKKEIENAKITKELKDFRNIQKKVEIVNEDKNVKLIKKTSKDIENLKKSQLVSVNQKIADTFDERVNVKEVKNVKGTINDVVKINKNLLNNTEEILKGKVDEPFEKAKAYTEKTFKNTEDINESIKSKYKETFEDTYKEFYSRFSSSLNKIPLLIEETIKNYILNPPHGNKFFQGAIQQLSDMDQYRELKKLLIKENEILIHQAKLENLDNEKLVKLKENLRLKNAKILDLYREKNKEMLWALALNNKIRNVEDKEKNKEKFYDIYNRHRNINEWMNTKYNREQVKLFKFQSYLENLAILMRYHTPHGTGVRLIEKGIHNLYTASFASAATVTPLMMDYINKQNSFLRLERASDMSNAELRNVKRLFLGETSYAFENLAFAAAEGAKSGIEDPKALVGFSKILNKASQALDLDLPDLSARLPKYLSLIGGLDDSTVVQRTQKATDIIAHLENKIKGVKAADLLNVMTRTAAATTDLGFSMEENAAISAYFQKNTTTRQGAAQAFNNIYSGLLKSDGQFGLYTRIKEGGYDEFKNVMKILENTDLSVIRDIFGSAFARSTLIFRKEGWTDELQKIFDETFGSKGAVDKERKKLEQTFQFRLMENLRKLLEILTPLQEELEFLILKITNEAIPALKTISKIFETYSPISKRTASYIVLVTGALIALGSILSVVAGGLLIIYNAFLIVKKALFVVLPFITSLAGIGKIIATIAKVISSFKFALLAFIWIFRHEILTAWEYFKTRLQEEFPNLFNNLSDFWDKIKEVINSVWEWIKTFPWDKIKWFVSEALKALGEIIIMFMKFIDTFRIAVLELAKFLGYKKDERNESIVKQGQKSAKQNYAILNANKLPLTTLANANGHNAQMMQNQSDSSILGKLIVEFRDEDTGKDPIYAQEIPLYRGNQSEYSIKSKELSKRLKALHNGY